MGGMGVKDGQKEVERECNKKERKNLGEKKKSNNGRRVRTGEEEEERE